MGATDIFDINLMSYVDPKVVVVLLCIGFVIKHFMPKLPNYAIPATLIVVSFLYYFLSNEAFNRSILLDSATSAIITATVAIGLHSSGKGLFEAFGSNNTEKKEDTEDE